jgi:hypothetical protein
MKLQSLFIALLCAITLFNCNRESSADVNQDRIYTIYELFYNANEDKTFARATFRFSNEVGTLLELSEPSQVTFNGDILTFNRVLAYYEREYAGFVDSGTFEWTDTEENTFINSAQVNNIDYAATIDTIDRSASYELNWSGNPLAEDELVTLTINGENEGDARLFTTNDIGASSIILAQNILEQVGQGPGTLFLDRSFSPELLDATGAGGRVTGRYRPKNQTPYMK